MSYSVSFSKSILVVIFISDKIRQEQFEYLSTASISEILNIPKPTCKILQSLNSEGIFETKEGKQGGIRLIKDLSQITVLDVFNTIEKGKALSRHLLILQQKVKGLIMCKKLSMVFFPNTIFPISIEVHLLEFREVYRNIR